MRTGEGCADALKLYFEENLEIPEIARRLGVSEGAVSDALGSERALEEYGKRCGAMLLRAKITLARSAEAAARVQAAMLACEDVSQAERQRAAKDILDRAGIGGEREDSGEIVIRFAGGAIMPGVPDREP